MEEEGSKENKWNKEAGFNIGIIAIITRYKGARGIFGICDPLSK